jgi:NADPH2:quinone reductase
MERGRDREAEAVRAAVLEEYGALPGARDYVEPTAGEGEVVVEVAAAGLNPVDLARAAGTFHGGSPDPPYVVGSEGVARLDGGGFAYFNSSRGSMAERATVRSEELVELPEGLDPALAVCFGIPGLAAWLALEYRAQIAEGETALILGATGPVGLIGVQAARLLGAGRVVGAARNADRLRRAEELGADATVVLGSTDDDAAALAEACGGEGPNVVVDPLWGAPGAAAIEAAAPHARIAQIGQSAGTEATLASATIRGKGLSILGFTNFQVGVEERSAAYRRMAEHAVAGELTCDVEQVPLDEIAQAWERQAAMPHVKLAIVP